MGNIQQPIFNVEHPMKVVEQASGLYCRASRPRAVAVGRLPLNEMSIANPSSQTKFGVTPNLTGATPVPPGIFEVGSSMLNVRCSRSGRAVIAREHAIKARTMLSQCHFCAHRCGVNRLAGAGGLCRAGAETRFFSAQVEVSDELELIPTFAVALSGCDLRCDFCITGACSWNARAGAGLSALEMAERARTALDHGARTIMILGGEPTVHLHAALELVAELPDSARLIWKTNGHGSVEARDLLDGMFNVWLADFKFGNDACALKLAGITGYGQIVRENLLWFAGAERRSPTRCENVGVQTSVCSKATLKRELQHAGSETGAPRGELIVRHLLMPGHVDCCWRPVAEWLAENLPGVKVNLRSGFWPAWHSTRHRELCGTVSTAESEQAWAIARDCSLNLIC